MTRLTIPGTMLFIGLAQLIFSNALVLFLFIWTGSTFIKCVAAAAILFFAFVCLRLKRRIYFDENEMVVGRPATGKRYSISEIADVGNVLGYDYLRLKRGNFFSRYLFFVPDRKISWRQLFGRKEKEDSPLDRLMALVGVTPDP